MADSERSAVMAQRIAEALASAGQRGTSLNGGSAGEHLSWAYRLSDDSHVVAAIECEWAHLARGDSRLQELLKTAHTKQGRDLLARHLLERLDRRQHERSTLAALLLETETAEGQPTSRRQRQRRFFRRFPRTAGAGWLKRQTSLVWMHTLILVPVAIVFVTVWGGLGKAATAEELSVAALKVFAVWVLAFVPSWLYVRFLGQGAGALWNEFVLNLHRLGLDDPKNLPKPPQASEYYPRWLAAGGLFQRERSNVYRLKFDSYYGSGVAGTRSANFTVKRETMFPVFLTTAVLAAGWVAVLWDTGFAETPLSVWDILKFGFLGAYAFTVQSLVRRFFQGDLRPSAYAAVILRVVLVFAVLLPLYQIIRPFDSATEAAVAFVVGAFPVMGIYALHRTAAVLLRWPLPQLTAKHALSDIDGLNLWYEARLLEEGIEDMESLVTANIVEVILHTRVPVARLVDWLDQAHLLMRLEVKGNTGGRRGNRRGTEGHQASAALSMQRRLAKYGVRSATDLLKAFPPDQIDPRTGDSVLRRPFQRLNTTELDMKHLRLLVRVLDEETGLGPIWNWQAGAPQAQITARQSRSRQLVARR